MLPKAREHALVPVGQVNAAALRPAGKLHAGAKVLDDRQRSAAFSDHRTCELVEVRPDAARTPALQCFRGSNVVGEHGWPFRRRQAGAGKAHTIMWTGSSPDAASALGPLPNATPTPHNSGLGITALMRCAA